MGKIAEIRNEDQDRICDLLREPDALYLSVKCSSKKGHSKVLKIKLSDVLYQLGKNMTKAERMEAWQLINTLAIAENGTV